ncbi:hypothetical protein [Hydrogenimonas sp.]
MAFYYIRTDGTSILNSDDDAVVLSPSTYWYAHAKFPTRSLAKARKLADGFMDTRPENYDAVYVEKRDGGYDCYAYDGDALKRRLEEAGAAGAPVWFLQQFVSQMPLRLDDERVAESINGVVVELPDASRSLPTLASLDLGAVAKPFNRRAESGFPVKSLVALTLLLAVTVTADLGVRFQKYLAVDEALERSRASRSVYEIRALVKKYEKVAAEQRKLRQSVAKALKKGRLTKLSCTPSRGCDVE